MLKRSLLKSSFLFICLFSAMLVACSKSDGPKPFAQNPVSAQEELVGSYGYQLDGKNSHGDTCSTGVKNFTSLHLMCINIQDPVQNGDCALDERIKKFQNDCEPQGYSFFESHVCTVSLLQKEAEISMFGEYDKKYLIKSQNYCAGRTSQGMTFSGFSDRSFFYEKIMANTEMYFYPRRETSRNHASYFKISFEEEQEDGSTKKLINDFTYTDDEKLESGSTDGGAYKYLITCAPTWACDVIK